MNFRDNLFSANHRSNMISRYGYTDAMTVTVDDLQYEATMETEYAKREKLKEMLDTHDCTASPEDSCVCQQESAEL